VIAVAGIITGNFIFFQQIQQEEIIFIMGYSGGLDSIDPLVADWYDPIILNQIVEPLFNRLYNQTSSSFENVPHLAKEGIWSEDDLNFKCTLREGIEFHDGAQFNAIAVKWNFDRLHRLLINTSNPSLWTHPDGTLIINNTIVLDDYTIRFVLNKPFAPFSALLTSLQANIVSPLSTPDNEFINVLTEKVIGTGPYIYESNVVYLNTTIVANNNYWGTPKPVIDRFIFIIGYDYVESNERFLAKETDYAGGLDSYFEEYINDPTIIVDDFVGLEYEYLGMNNIRINTTMRKAISYALNYSLILETNDFYSQGSQIRCKSPLPLGTIYSNWEDFDVPNYNITKARQVLKDNNWPGTESLTVNNNVTPGNEWESIAYSLAPLSAYNVSHIIGQRMYL
jgi:peptide/nickel transport system substrate-binding protein